MDNFKESGIEILIIGIIFIAALCAFIFLL